MDKAKLIQTLKNIPEEWFKQAYTIDIWSAKEIRLQMYYNSKLAAELTKGNKWKMELRDTGYLEFKRDDGLKITMT